MEQFMIVIYDDHTRQSGELVVGPFDTVDDALVGLVELAELSHPDAILIVARVMSFEDAMKKTQKDALARFGF